LFDFSESHSLGGEDESFPHNFGRKQRSGIQETIDLRAEAWNKPGSLGPD
jgi:hypothetical protein